MLDLLIRRRATAQGRFSDRTAVFIYQQVLVEQEAIARFIRPGRSFHYCFSKSGNPNLNRFVPSI